MPPLDLSVALVQTTPAAVWVCNSEGVIVTANPALGALLPDVATPVGLDATVLLARPREISAFRLALRAAARSGAHTLHRTGIPALDGQPARSMLWAIAPVPTSPGLVSVVGLDVSTAHSELRSLQKQARTDELTGLANRTQLLATLDGLAGQGATVLFCDLNGFKAVNDTYGHAAGDEVLVEVGRRFLRAVRGEDLVARWGGDEFVIVAPADPCFDPAGLCRRVLRSLQQPMLLSGGVVVLVGAAVGQARMDPGLDATAVLEQADLKMYAAKQGRPGRVRASLVP